MSSNNIKKVYDALKSSGYTDMGSLEEFTSSMSDNNNRKLVYDALSQEGYSNLGDFDAFSNRMFGSVSEPTPDTAEVAESTNVAKQEIYEPIPVSATDDTTIRGFVPAFEQSANQLGAGIKYAVGEYAEKSSDYENAYNRMSELIDDGVDFSNFDVDKQVNEHKKRDYYKQLSEWQAEIAKRKEERKGMKGMGALKHRWNDPKRPTDPFDRRALATAERYTQEGIDKELDTKRTYTLIEQALKDADGDAEKAKALLDERRKQQTWGERMQEEAKQTFADARPTEGFGAWLGNLAPQMVGNTLAVAAMTNPYTRWLARPLGMANMAALTASSGGSSAYEARKYGEEKGVEIDDATARRAGLLSAGIEAATEYIPFENYYNVASAYTKKKLGNIINRDLVSSPRAQGELAKLVERASKELGGTLINGKNMKEWVVDAGLEGLSEFMAEGGGALIPMIYQNENDYPTLKSILVNGWEGAKAGMFMGAFLGGSSRVVNHYANRDRRKKAGHVDLAETTDGKIVEVLGFTGDDYSVMLPDGGVKHLKREELGDIVSIPFNEFDKETLSAETISAYEEGKSAEINQYYNVNVSAEEAFAVIEEKYPDMAKQAKSWVDASPSEVQRYLNDLPEDERVDIGAYLAAEMKRKGVIDGVKERTEAEVESFSQQLEDKTDANGNVSTATYKDRQVFVKDVQGDNAVIMLDGKPTIVNSKDLSDIATQNVDEVVAEYSEQVSAKAAQDTDFALNNHPKTHVLAMGETMNDVDGKTYKVVRINGSEGSLPEQMLYGVVECAYDAKTGMVQPKNGVDVMQITYNDMLAIQNDYYNSLDAKESQQLESNNLSENETENESTPSGQIEQSVSEEVADGQNVETQPTETESVAPAAPQTARERVPKDDKGNPIYEQTDADTAWDAIVEETEGDTEMAQRVAVDMLEDKKAALAKLQNGKPKKGATVAEKIANEKAHAAAIAQAQSDVAQWEAIVGTEARRREAAMSEADRYAAEMEQKNINEGLAALGEPQSLEEYVLGQLAGDAYKLRWSDKENGTKGFGSHTGLSTEEMKARLSMIDNKNGLTPEEVAHSIVENMDASFGEVDVMDVTNMVIDAVSTHASRRSMLNGMVESRAELLRQQEIAEQEAKDAWYMEQYHATEEELAAYNEYLAEFAEEIYGEDTDYEQRIATFAEIQLEYDNQGTDAGLRSSADQGEGLASDREGSSSVGETEQLDRRELREDAAGVAEAEDGRTGSSVSAQSDDRQSRIDRAVADYRENVDDSPEAIAAAERDQQRYEADMAEDAVETVETLENGDVRRTNRNSNGEIATVVIERDGNVISVDTYEDGALFERTDYDANGNATKVTRYKDGEVVSEQEYKDGKRKVTANVGDVRRTPLPELEYVKQETDRLFNERENQSLSRKEWELTDEGVDAENAAIDSYPSYIQSLSDSGELQWMFDSASVGEEIQIRRAVEAAGLELDDVVDTSVKRANAKAARDKKRAEKAKKLIESVTTNKEKQNGSKETIPEGGPRGRRSEKQGENQGDTRQSKSVIGRQIEEFELRTGWTRGLSDTERLILEDVRKLTDSEISALRNEAIESIERGEDVEDIEIVLSLLEKYGRSGERLYILSQSGIIPNQPVLLDKVEQLFMEYNEDEGLAILFDRLRPVIEQINPKITFEVIRDVDGNVKDSTVGDFYLKDNHLRFNLHSLNSSFQTDQEKANTIVHEMLHAVTQYALDAKQRVNNGEEVGVELSNQLLDAAQSLINIYNAVKGNPVLAEEYGIKDVHEMVSELANPEFRDKLKQIEVKGKSAWERIKDAIKRFLNRFGDIYDTSAYSKAMSALDELMDNFDIKVYERSRALGSEAKESRVDNLRFREKEEPKELIAVHNISEDNLKKVLEAGSLIMPSIAITKADMGHTGFGDISLLFDKSTINPSDRRNKVYGGDAWTPRFPRIGVKLNEKVVSRINKKAYELIEDRRLREIFSLSSEVYPDNIEKVISDYGVEGYYNKEWIKLAYLLDSGKKVKIPTKAKDYGIASEDIVRLAKEKGLSVKEIYEDYDFYKNNPDFVAQVKEARDEARLSSIPEEQRDEMRERMQSRPLSEAAFDSYIRGALGMENDLANGGLKEVVDRQALRDLIEKKVKTDNAEYNKWVDNLFEGIVEKRGIRNNRDWYTPSGSLRPWGQLYDPATPANILKYMLAENEQGGSGGFFDSNIMGASAETYDSIEEIREKGKKRLKQLPYEEYDEWSNSVADRMAKICDDFLSPSQKNSMGGAIDAKIEITNAVAKDKTAKSIYKHMHREYPNFTMEHAKQVEEIVKEIQEFATDYFEAKPQRLVSVNEVMAAVVPSNASKEIVDALKNNGIEVVTYKKSDEEARKRVVKRVSSSLDIKFREGEGVISDREVSYENDPIAKFMGKPRYYGKRAAAFAERERRRMENAAKEAAEMLGIEAEIITDASTLQGRKAKAKGWYDIVNKKVVVVVPNHVSMGDAVRTVLHEGIAHHGLRELFGDGFDAMLDNVYNNVSPELKARIDAIAERTGVSTSVATEEYMASLAETTNFEEAQRRGWWQQIKSYFVDMLRKLAMPGLKLKEEITDNELRYLLWRSYKNLVEPNSYLRPLGYAEDVVKQKELKVGEYAEKAPATPMAADTSEAEEWAAVTMQRIGELEAQAAQLENEIAKMEADRDADDASRYEMWEQQLEPLRKQMEDVYAELEGLYSLEAEAEEMSMASEEGLRYRSKDSTRRQERNRINNNYENAVSLLFGIDKKKVREERIAREKKRREDAKEIYDSVLSGDFNDVTLQKINDYIDDATPQNPFGRRISQRLPQKLERGLHEGGRTNAVDALFSRISESAVPANERISEAGRRKAEERKKELLKGWAIATGNWHTDLSAFVDDTTPIGEGTDSKVYLAKDGAHVIKASKGKPYGKRFRPDMDNIALFNRVFYNSRYEIVGYGEINGEFVRILKQPIVDFTGTTPLTPEERVEYMKGLKFEPINDSKTAFSNGEIVISDLQKSNIVKDAAGNVRVIDADAKLHTKDVGGNYTYPPVEADLPQEEDSQEKDRLRYREGDDTKLMDALADAYASGDAAAIQDAVNDIMNAIRLDDADPSIGNLDWEKVENYNGTDPRLLAAQYIVRAQHHLYLDEDYDTEYIKTGIKTVSEPIGDTAEEDVNRYTNDFKHEREKAQRQFEKQVEESRNSHAKGTWLWNGLMSIEEIRERHQRLIDEFENLLSTHQFDKAADKLGEIRAWQNAAKRHIDNPYSEIPYVGEDVLIAEIERESAALGVPVRIARSVDELPDDAETRKRAEDGSLKGVYSTRGGEVVVYLPNTGNANDAKRTILHEIVGHKGLRSLIGEQQYDKAMLQLMYMLPADVRDAVLRRAERHGWNAAIAMDEYLAEQAERDVQPTWWGKVNAKIRALLRNLGFDVKLTDADVTYLLWRSRKKLQGDDLNDMAVNAILKQAARKSAEAWVKDNFTWASSDSAVRERTKALSDMANAEYEEAVMSTQAGNMLSGIWYALRNGKKGFKSLRNDMAEAYLDGTRAVAEAQKAIEKKRGRKIRGYEDIHSAHNAKSSKDQREIFQLNDNILQPMSRAVANLINKAGKSFEEFSRYLNAKHGLERNVKFAERDAENESEKLRQNAIRSAERIAESRREGAEADYNDALANLDALRNEGRVGAVGYASQSRKLKEQYDNKLAKIDTDFKAAIAQAEEDKKTKREELLKEYRKNDYSGLTAIFTMGNEEKKPTIKELERRAQEYVDAFESSCDKNQLDLVWKLIRIATKFSVEKMYNSGLISKEQRDSMMNNFEYYVPLRGWKDDYTGDVYSYIASGNPEAVQQIIKHAKGRESEADNILGTIFSMANYAIVLGNKNEVNLKLLNLAYNDPSGLLNVEETWYEETESGELVPLFPDMSDKNLTSEQKMQKIEEYRAKVDRLKNEGKAKLVRNPFKEGYPLHAKAWQEQQHAVMVKRGGEEFVVWVNGNPKLAQALNGLLHKSQREAEDSMMSNILRWMAATQTSYSPEFWLTNLQRDLITANTGNFIKYGAGYEKEFAKNLANLLPVTSFTGKKDKLSGVGIFKLFYLDNAGKLDMNNPVHKMFKEFADNGGMTGISQITDPLSYEKKMLKEIDKELPGIKSVPAEAVEAIGNGVEFINRGFENATRFATYMTSRQMGKGVTESIRDAKDVSVNFNMKGSGAWGNAFMRKYFIYFNAAIQGLRTVATWHEASKKRFYSVGGSVIAASVALAIINDMLSGGDDDDENAYYGLSEWNRYNFFNIKIGENSFLHWSLPQEYRPIYALGQIGYDLVSGRISNDRALKSAIVQLNNLSPFSFVEDSKYTNPDDTFLEAIIKGLVPSQVKPLVDVYTNEDFLGRRVHGQTDFNRDLPEYKRVTETTPQFLIEGSRVLSEISGGRENKRGWLDNKFLTNPSITWYLLKAAGGGTITFLGKFANMSKWDEEWTEVPILPKFVATSGDDYSKQRLTNDKYWKYRKGYEEIHKELTRNKNDEDMSKERRKEIEDELKQGKKYEYYTVLKKYESKYKTYKELIEKYEEEGNAEKEQEYRDKMFELKKKIVAEIEDNN